MSANIIAALLQRPVAYHPIFKEVGGSTVSGIFLSQAYYWSTEGRIPAERDGWFYKKQPEWEKETGLSRSEQERARRDLIKAGVLEEVRKDNPARLWFRLNVDAVHIAISEIAESCNPNKNNSMQNPAIKSAESSKQECRIPQTDQQDSTIKNAESCNLSVQRLLTENTSESTPVADVEGSEVDLTTSEHGVDENHLALRLDTTQTAEQLLKVHQPRERFAMHFDWQPSQRFSEICQVMGVNLSLFNEDQQEQALGEFRVYWSSRDNQLNQTGWEHKLANRVKSLQVTQAANDSQQTTQGKRAAVSAAIMDINDQDW